MTKRNNDNRDQLVLNLSGDPCPRRDGLFDGDQRPCTSSAVVSFVDASTLAVRRNALRRVAASGIFAVPTRTKL